MPTTLKTEAIVLRGIKYGEADRILNLYTPDRGRVGVMARGARRAKSKLGGRVEPFAYVEAMLYEGKGSLFTLTGAHTLKAFHRLRENMEAIDVASRACDAVTRLTDEGQPNAAIFNLLLNELTLLDADSKNATLSNSLTFRLKLLVTGGLTPQVATCATCGSDRDIAAFSGAAGGVVCSSCEAGGFPFGGEAREFLAQALANRLVDAPTASDGALRQVEHAISTTAEHHAHVRLKPAFAA